MRKSFITSILAIVMIAFLFPISAFAKVDGGTKNINVGGSVQLEAEGPGHTVTGTWSVSGNTCYISSRSNRACTVTGIRSGSSTVTWIGASDGRMEEIYWTINVTGNGGGGNSGGGNNSTPDTGFPDSWTSSGNYSISWYDKTKSEYHISTAKELAGLAYLVNNGYDEFQGKTIKLDADIDLSGKNWTTIGDGYNYDYMGAFDGQNHTISGIYIVSQHEKQTRYGLWAGLYNTTIKNVKLQGKVNIENDKTLYSGFDSYNYAGDAFIGGFVGFAHNVYFENCHSDMDVVCKRNHPNGQIMLGGIAGMSRFSTSNKVAMKYCSHNGSLHASEWNGATNPPCIGGLVGNSGLSSGFEDGIYEYCENFSSLISCNHPNSDHNKNYVQIGGIIGYSYGGKAKISHCRSIIDNIKITQKCKATMFFKIGGIAGEKSIIINCYSSVNIVDVNSVEMWNNSGYAQIGGISPEVYSTSAANYSNSDIKKTCNVSLKEGYDGSKSFSSNQMKTGAFLEELNTYPQINIGEAIWTADELGYPCIAKTHYNVDSNLENKLEINAVNFPDENFRDYLLSLDEGKDGKFSESEISKITDIKVDSKGICSLKGIEYFTALTYLSCPGNQLENLDLSKNTALKSLDCGENQLIALDMSPNTALTSLDCHRNQLTALDVSQNTELLKLICGGNKLTSLDVSKNTALTGLDCFNNQLTLLDVSNNTALTRLYCYNNQLTSLNVSKNTALEDLACFNNQLTSLDVSNNSAIIFLYCYGNQIRGAAMDQLIEGLRPRDSSPLDRYGLFRVISDMNEGNVCTKNQVAAAKAKGWTPLCYNGTEWVEYEGSDPADVIEINATNFPDENFRNYLLGRDYGKDGIITKDEIERITELSINKKKISTLQGIEYFTALTFLDCSENQLTSVDVSKNIALIRLDCGDNQLTTLDVSGNTALTRMCCYYNQLTALNVSKNTALENLECSNNQLKSIELAKNTALEYLSCSQNQLTSLDVSKNTALIRLGCYNNQLTSLNVSKNTALKELACFNNQLTSLDVSNNSAIILLYCYGNQIRGAAMDQLIEGLRPWDSSPKDRYGLFRVISDMNEGNVCTKSQVAAAKAKWWLPLCYNGSEWVEYPGIDDVMPGDINGDGKVDVSDYIGVANRIVGNTPAGFIEKAGDVDGSGTIDVSDYIGIANVILTGNIYGSSKSRVLMRAATNLDGQNNVIYVSPLSVEKGITTANLSICMKNGAAIRGFQFDLYLPDNVTAAKNAKGRITASLNKARLADDDEHTLTVAEQADGAIRFLCGSQYDKTFIDNDGEVATLIVNLPQDLLAGDYPIILKNIKLTETDISKYYETESLESLFTMSGTTGISTSAMDKDGADKAIYSLSGQKLEKLRKGINIIGGKRVVVK